MAALEYLTENSLTYHPFKTRSDLRIDNLHPIGDDWFVDMLFVSFSPAIAGVYISRLEKSEIENVFRVTFRTTDEADTELQHVEIPLNEVVSHYGTFGADAFASYACDDFAVKFVFGPGIVVKPSFVQDYTKYETTLANNAFIPSTPKVRKLTFKAYSGDLSKTLVASFEHDKNLALHDQVHPVVLPQHNTEFKLESTNSGGLYVEPGLGLGLYDDCVKPGFIEDVYEINNIKPNERGEMFFTVSNCYSNNVVTSNDLMLYNESMTGRICAILHIDNEFYRLIQLGTVGNKPRFISSAYELFWNNAENDEDKRWNLKFRTNDTVLPASTVGGAYPWEALWTENIYVDDVTMSAHGLFLVNYCKPKCPPENINAFAHYLNRVADGVNDLYKLVTNNYELRGTGTWSGKIFTVSAFCDGLPEDDPFARCAGTAQYIPCSRLVDGQVVPYTFEKYFDEGKTLFIRHSEIDIGEYRIKQVLSPYSVVLDIAPPSASNTPMFFKVNNCGVYQTFNCAFNEFNELSKNNLEPYFKVKYTTSESFNPAGNYVTYLAVVVALFNPSTTDVTLEVDLSTEGQIYKQGDYKVRTDNGVYQQKDRVVSLTCRQYAFFEVVYFIPCNPESGGTSTNSGTLTVRVFNKNLPGEPDISEPFPLPGIDGFPCEYIDGEVIDMPQFSFYALQGDAEAFSKTAEVASNVVAIQNVYNDVPDWLSYSLDVEESEIVFTAISDLTSTVSRVYTMIFELADNAGVLSKIRIKIVYIAHPVMRSPVPGRYTQQQPLYVDPDKQYTLNDPLFVLLFDNMNPLDDSSTQDYSGVYVATLPAGLTLAIDNKSIIGQLSENTPVNNSYVLTLGASNPATGDLPNQRISENIYLNLGGIVSPVIDFLPTATNPSFNIDNITDYSEVALYRLSESGGAITQYSLTGALFTGLVFDPSTGKILGKATHPTSGVRTYSLKATGLTGDSNVLSFSLNYTARLAPKILSPAVGTYYRLSFSDEFSIEQPLFTVVANQMLGDANNFAGGLTDETRNVYSLLDGGPPGFVIDQYTGKFYGELSEVNNDPLAVVQYVIPVQVKNLVGKDTIYFSVEFTHGETPNIYEPPDDNAVFTVSRGTTYTTSSPLAFIFANKQPTSYTYTGTLPAGLSLVYSPTLKAALITGTVSTSVAASKTEITVVAHKGNLQSAPVKLNILIPIQIDSPAANAVHSAQVSSQYTELNPLLTLTTTGVPEGEQVVFTQQFLPAGFSLAGDKIIGGSASISTANVVVTATTQNYGSHSTVFSLIVTSAVYSLSGNISTLQGSPVQGATVSIGGGTADTDASGNYAFPRLAPALYRVSASKSGYEIIPTSRSVRIATSNVQGINFTATYGRIVLSGSIQSANLGKYINRVRILVNGSTIVYPNTQGEFSFIADINSSYTIAPTAEDDFYFDPVSVTINTAEQDVGDINFTLVEKFIISGTAALPGSLRPVGGLDVYLNRGQGSEVVQKIFDSSFQFYVLPGIYELEVNPEYLLIQLNAFPFEAAYAFSPSVRTITITNASATNQTFTAELISKIAGVVVGGSTSQGGTIPVVGAVITAISGLQTYTATTDQDGRYTIANIPNGTYAVSCSFAGASFASYASVQIVTLGSTQTVNFQNQNDRKISGTVLQNATQRPLERVLIELYSDDVEETVYRGVFTDSQGAYEFLGIPQGGYRLRTVNEAIDTTPQGYTITVAQNDAVYNFSGTLKSSYDTPPQPPVLTNIASSSTNITVNFVLPASAQYLPPISLEYSIDAGTTWYEYSTPEDTSIIISSTEDFILDGGVTYNVKLRYSDIAGTSSSSNQLSVSLIQYATKPVIISIDEFTTSALVNFTQSTLGVGTSITNYEYLLELLRVDASSFQEPPTLPAGTLIGIWQPFIPAKTSSPLYIANLGNDRDFALALRAVTPEGQGSMSVPTLLTTPVNSGPSMAGVVGITRTSSTSANIRISRPVDSGGTASNPFVIIAYDITLDGGATFTRENIPSSLTTFIPMSGLVPGNLYDVQVRAVNTYANGPWSAVFEYVHGITAPSAPTIIQSSINPRSLVCTATIQAPSDDGGADITNYAYSLDNGATYTAFSPAGTGTSRVIPLPSVTTRYFSRVRAINSIGAGPGSIAFQLGGIPNQPSIDSVISVSATRTSVNVTLRGTRATSNYPTDLPVSSHYLVIVAGGDSFAGGTVLDVPGSSLSDFVFTVDTLAAGHTYTVALAGANGRGIGLISDSVSINVPALPPDAPNIIQYIRTPGLLSSSIDLFFETGYIGATAITQVIVTAEDQTDFTTTQKTFNIGQTYKVSYGGLFADTTYKFAMKVFNGTYWSEFSGDVYYSTAEGPPNAVGNITVDPYYSSSEPVLPQHEIIVSWTAPRDSGEPVVSYDVRVNGTTTYNTGNTATQKIFTGLTEDTEYSYEVRAVSAMSNGPWSEVISGSTLPFMVPSAITDLSVSLNQENPADGTALLGWDNPLITGGKPITHYTLFISVLSNGEWSAISPIDAPQVPQITRYGVDPRWTCIGRAPTCLTCGDGRTYPQGYSEFVEFEGNTSYRFYIKAHNEIGASDFSNYAQVTFTCGPTDNFDELCPTGSFNIQSIVNNGGNPNVTTLTLIVTPPFNGMSTITGYRVIVNNGAYSDFHETGPGTTVIIFDLIGFTNDLGSGEGVEFNLQLQPANECTSVGPVSATKVFTIPPVQP
jgi:hypothetical protein